MQRRKRFGVLSLGGLAAVALAFVLSSAPAPSACAAGPCQCLGSYETSVQCGTGATCQAAQSAVWNLTYQEALSQCTTAVCNNSINYKNECWSCSGGKCSDATMLFGCCAPDP